VEEKESLKMPKRSYGRGGSRPPPTGQIEKSNLDAPEKKFADLPGDDYDGEVDSPAVSFLNQS
jgi:hypothetical protein